MPPPTVRQIYALAAALCERSGEEFPTTREAASEAIERLRAENGHPAPRLQGLSLRDRICHACLSFVSLAIDSGDERKVAGSITRMAPDLWAEGLAQPVRLALERARKRGVANADEAIVAVDKSGPRSPIVRAIVRRLAADLSARAKGDLFRMGWQPWPPRNLGV